MILSTDSEVISLPQYPIIEDVVEKLNRSGLLANLNGNCFAAVEMLSAMLQQSGVECVIVECQVSIRTRNEDGTNSFHLIGYDNFAFNGQVDTHVVVITKTAVPVLIDLSITTALPEDHPFVVEKVNNTDPDVIGSYIFGNYHLIYQAKRNIRFPSLHQKTFIERVNKDVAVEKKIKTAELVIKILLAFTVINFIANISIILLKLN